MKKIILYLLTVVPICAIAQTEAQHEGQLRYKVLAFYKDQIKPFILPDSLGGKKLNGLFFFDCSVDSIGNILSVAVTDIFLYHGSLSDLHKKSNINKVELDIYYNRVKGCWGKGYSKARPYINWANQEFTRTIKIKRKKAPPPGYKFIPVKAVNYITIREETQ